MPTLAAAAYLRMAGRPPVLPSSELSYSENFLYMLDSLYVTYFHFRGVSVILVHFLRFCLIEVKRFMTLVVFFGNFIG